jgi:hypothetical protein
MVLWLRPPTPTSSSRAWCDISLTWSGGLHCMTRSKSKEGSEHDKRGFAILASVHGCETVQFHAQGLTCLPLCAYTYIRSFCANLENSYISSESSAHEIAPLALEGSSLTFHISGNTSASVDLRRAFPFQLTLF